MGMRVVVFINISQVAILDLVRVRPADPTPPGEGTGDYRATLYTFGAGPPESDPVPESWDVIDHDRATGHWGLVADALAQRPEHG